MKEQRSQRVGLVVAEDPRPVVGHCTPDKVEDEWRMRPVAYRVVAEPLGILADELWPRPLNKVEPVTQRAPPLREDGATLNRIAAAGRKLLSFGPDP